MSDVQIEILQSFKEGGISEDLRKEDGSEQGFKDRFLFA